ncbi:MAG: class IV adenylate cyclase [Vicinamibacteria bacterium]|nr:class IV adenylate cyclase [Vicinamibacteria bacterium]
MTKTKRPSSLEREVKLRVADAKAARRALARIGAALERARHFEDNVVLDDESRSLSKSDRLLRIRRDGRRSVITFKGPRRAVRGIKSRREIEFEAHDAEAAGELFSGLGYRTIFRYQKYRAIYSHGGVEIMLDETPIGTFIEIEGRPPEIRRAAAALGYDAGDYIGASYADLFIAAGGVGDMVFR